MNGKSAHKTLSLLRNALCCKLSVAFCETLFANCPSIFQVRKFSQTPSLSRNALCKLSVAVRGFFSAPLDASGLS